MKQPVATAAARRRLVLGLAISHVLALPALAEPQATTLDKVVVSGARVAEADIAIGTDQVRNTIAIDHEALLSAPAGIGAPVMILAASPGPISRPGRLPAVSSATSRRSAPPSAARTA